MELNFRFQDKLSQELLKSQAIEKLSSVFRISNRLT